METAHPDTEDVPALTVRRDGSLKTEQFITAALNQPPHLKLCSHTHSDTDHFISSERLHL